MYNQRLEKLREAMRREHIDMYMLTTDDPNFSGKVRPEAHWKTIEYLTGFSCSYAFMLITEDTASFWTDFRYIELAKKKIKLGDLDIYDVTTLPTDYYLEWIGEKEAAMSKDSFCFAIDGRTIAYKHAEVIRAKLNAAADKKVKWIGSLDLVGEIWDDRPEEIAPELYELELKYAGEDRVSKLSRLRERMGKMGCDVYLNATMDAVAWMMNLRGKVPYGPMFHSSLIVGTDYAKFFCHDKQLSEELSAEIKADGYDICDLDSINEVLSAIPAGSKVYYDRINDLMAQSIADSAVFVNGGRDPVSCMKCVKNEKEIECFRKAGIADGVVLARVIKKVKEEVAAANFRELDLTPIFHEFRKDMNDYPGDASPIQMVSYMANAASPHYFPDAQNNAEIKASGTLLFDVGATFYGATTDVSRTIYLGPSEYDEELRHDYSMTLKALIDLGKQIFRRGTDGACLDSVARCVMWNDMMNYSHGTGHGIGAGLNCHEGPIILGQSTYKRDWATSDYPIEPGMIYSNEPGVYKPGRYGIRLEDDVLAVRYGENEFGEFYRSETLSMCPFDRELILPELLSDEELKWLNDYHATVYENLSPLLTEEEREWLKEQTAEIFR